MARCMIPRLALTGVALLMPIVGCACRTPRGPLVPADSIEPLRTLREAARCAPRRERAIEVGDACGGPLSLHVVETGPGDRDRLVICLHGFMMDAHDWDAVAGDLWRDHDVAAIDLPGAGLSDRPPAERLGPEGYSPSGQGRCVWLAISALLRECSPTTRVTLVGESHGAIVAIRMLGDPALDRYAAPVRARIDRLVLFAPTDTSVVSPSAALARLATLTGLEVAIGNALGVVERGSEDFVRHNTDDGSPAPIDEARRMTRILADPASRKAAQATITSVVPLDGDGRPRWPGVERIDAFYDRVSTPALLVWGARDELVPVSMGYRIVARIRGAKLRIVPATKHFFASWERPRIAARLIREFESPARGGPSTIGTVEVGDER